MIRRSGPIPPRRYASQFNYGTNYKVAIPFVLFADGTSVGEREPYTTQYLENIFERNLELRKKLEDLSGAEYKEFEVRLQESESLWSKILRVSQDLKFRRLFPHANKPATL